jgi:hypothetical protein
VTLDLRDVPPGFEYNEHYAIVVLGTSKYVTQVYETE